MPSGPLPASSHALILCPRSCLLSRQQGDRAGVWGDNRVLSEPSRGGYSRRRDSVPCEDGHAPDPALTCSGLPEPLRLDPISAHCALHCPLSRLSLATEPLLRAAAAWSRGRGRGWVCVWGGVCECECARTCECEHRCMCVHEHDSRGGHGQQGPAPGACHLAVAASMRPARQPAVLPTG